MQQEVLEQLNMINLDNLTKKLVQDQEKQNSGKYKHVKKTKDNNGVDYSVTEYVCPNGDIGFDIIYTAVVDGEEYTKTVCFGAESLSRQHDWAKIIKED